LIQHLSIVRALVCSAQRFDATVVDYRRGNGNIAAAFAEREREHRIEQRRAG
jgi:hypothetical protein